MTPRVYYKRLDRFPALLATIKDANGDAVDLTNATAVKFWLKNAQTGEVKINGADATFQNPRTAGQVKYEWDADDLDTPGEWEAEFKLTWPTSLPQTTPNDGRILVTVTAGVS